MTTISKVIKGVELELEFNYIPGSPGKLDGPWESSYPEEFAEIEMLSIKVGGIDIKALLSADLLEFIDELACLWMIEQ